MSDESNALRELKDESKNLVEYLDGMARSIVPAFREKHHAQALHVIALWKVIADAVEKIESLTRERDLALAATDAILDECEATMAIAKTTNDTLRVELDAAKVDTERLNWLEESESHLVSHRESFGVDDPESEYSIWWNVTDHKGKKSISGHPIGDARIAIDTARSRGETEETK